MLTYACPAQHIQKAHTHTHTGREATYICYYRTNSQIFDRDRASERANEATGELWPNDSQMYATFFSIFPAALLGASCAVGVAAN